MNYTKIDNLMLEMIKPKIDEIESKFSNGEGLDQSDINTLLLKSQFNHINHLDLKLNEVTDSVIGLKDEFHIHKQEISDILNRFDAKNEKRFVKIETDISDIKDNYYSIDKKVDKLELSISKMNDKFVNMNDKLDRSIENTDLKFANMNDKFANMNDKFAGMDIKIQDAIKQGIITNIKFTLGSIGLLAVAFKVMDMLVK